MIEEPVSHDFANTLHQRLISGNLTAPAEIAETYLPFVLIRLTNRFPSLPDPQWVEMAVDDALLAYLRQPTNYDPTRLSLGRYLLMTARGDLLNLIRKEQKSGLAGKFQFVELDDPAREYEVEEDGVLSVEEQVAIITSPVWTRLASLLTEPIDQEIAILMLEGIRETGEYAAVLKVSDLPEEQQRAEVKRNKDRIKTILQRNISPKELGET
jgi:hypothetical protein